MDSRDDTTTPAQETSSQPSRLPSHWKLRLVFGGFLLGCVLLVWLLAATVVPREWAQWISDRTGGGTIAGLGLGLLLGLVFTLLPITVLRQTLRLIPWGVRLGLVLLAILLALPNLMTLGIVVGDGSAAHAGERILDVRGTGFRAGTLIGAILAGLLGLGLFLRGVVRTRSVR